jgi:hypothetical protein
MLSWSESAPAQRRTAWLVILLPALAFIRPTERISVLCSAGQRAAKEPLIIWPAIVGFLLFAALYLWLARPLQHPWVYWLPSAIVFGNWLALCLRTRAYSAMQPASSHTDWRGRHVILRIFRSAGGQAMLRSRSGAEGDAQSQSFEIAITHWHREAWAPGSALFARQREAREVSLYEWPPDR